MIELFVMLGALSAWSFLGGVIVTRELCHIATEQQREAEQR